MHAPVSNSIVCLWHRTENGDAMGNLTLPWTYRKIRCAFCKVPLRQKHNKGSGKTKSQTSKHKSVFQNVNQAAAKQTYFTTGLAAKPKQEECCRICLSPGQVNQAVSSALFYFR